MPEKTSTFAEEGTKAHALAEWMLTLNGTSPEGVTVEMRDHVVTYVHHVEELSDAEHTVLHVEVRVKVNDEIYGTADAVVWNPVTKTLCVRDLKYGTGVPVEVCGNLQLKIYALAALLTMGYPARVVDVGIVQPRCAHPDGPIRSITFKVVDLIDFHAELLDAAKRVRRSREGFNASFDLTPSEKGCRWCLAAPKCPALLGKAQAMARAVFAPGLPYDPKSLAESLQFMPILEGWIKNTREFAYAEAEKGNAIPHHKLVEKRATRKWIDEGAAAATIDGLGLGVECYDAPTVKSPAAIEKLLPKDQRAILDELTIKESSGHTLVHESDKREAIRVDAKAAFS